MGENAVNFGAIADCQYCNEKSKGIRKYALSKQKLSKCVDHLNTMDLAFVVHLGDFIDRDFKSFDEVLNNAKKLGYAESDPSDDLNGNDVSSKLKILSSLCFNTFLVFAYFQNLSRFHHRRVL